MLDAQIKKDLESQDVASVLTLTKVPAENGSILLLGLSDDVFFSPNDIMFQNTEKGTLNVQCYIDPSFVPDLYSPNMNELSVKINHTEYNHVCKTFQLPYDFPDNLISEIDDCINLPVSCNFNQQMSIAAHSHTTYDDDENEANETNYGYVYVPLLLLTDHHIKVSAVALIMPNAITPAVRKNFEERYSSFNISNFRNPVLSSWSKMTYEMLGEVVKEMWLVEIIMFACMMNQLVFWDVLMHRLTPAINKCYMIGSSKKMIRFSLVAFLLLTALSVLLLASPVYILFMKMVKQTIEPGSVNLLSTGAIWTIGFICYCLPCALGRIRGGRQ